MAPVVPIAVGSDAPDFFARASDGRGLWLQSLRGKTVVLHFFPTAGVAAAAEARRYRARADELRAQGVEVVGATTESAAAQTRFAAHHKLAFPLVSDERGDLARKYGVHMPARPSRGLAFVIDERGAVEVVFERAEDVLEFLRDRARQSLHDAPRSSLRSLSSREGLVVQGRYRLKEMVGKGGLGEVWRAEHLHLKRDVAVKILTDPPAGEAGDDDWIEPCVRRFRFEAQVSALLGGRTRHVVSVFDAGYDAVGPYLAMEFIEGRALDQEIEASGPLAPERLAPLLDQLADALGAAHDAGVIHRDLKPANVMLQRNTTGGMVVKLTDFGIAKARADSSPFDRPKDTAVTQLVGTPEYMSPEQLRGTTGAEPTIDVWALGVLVYEALTGRLPFEAESTTELILKVVRDPAVAPTKHQPRLPAGLDEWMARALAKSPVDRFPTVAEAVRAYHHAIAVRTRATTPFSLAPRDAPETRSAAPVECARDVTSAGSRGRSTLAVLGLAAGGAVVTAALWLLRAPDAPPAPIATVTAAAPDRAAPTPAAADAARPATEATPSRDVADLPDALASEPAKRSAPRASTPARTPDPPSRRRAPRAPDGRDPSATF